MSSDRYIGKLALFENCHYTRSEKSSDQFHRIVIPYSNILAYWLNLTLNGVKKTQLTNTLEIRIWSEASILYYIRHASVILIVGIHL